MALSNSTLVELSDDHDDDYRYILATSDARIDLTISEHNRTELVRQLVEIGDGAVGENVDEDAGDPFDKLADQP